MKRYIAIALMLLVAYLQAGFMALHPLQINLARTHAASRINSTPTGRLVRLAFHKTASIHFKDEGKEIYLHGQMYDILQREGEGDSLVFHCYHDVEESALMAFFEKGLDALFEKETQAKDLKVTYELKLEYLPTESIVFSLIQNKKQCSFAWAPLFPGELDFPTPPPRIG